MHAVTHEGKTVFLEKNPAYEGCRSPIEEDISLYFPDDVFEWADGGESPRICVGVSNKNQKWFKVFSSERECKKAGYRKIVNGPPRIYESWGDFLLKMAQRDLMPERARECIAINLETGEYVLARTPHEVYEAFRKRWGDLPRFARHVDGSPLIRFHTPFRKVVRK